MRISNQISAHKAGSMCWVLSGEDEDSPNYLLYAQELAGDWWELVLAQITDNIDQEYFCLTLEIFKTKVYARKALGIDSSLMFMAKDLVGDSVRIDDPSDFRDAFGGEIVGFGDAETQLWH